MWFNLVLMDVLNQQQSVFIPLGVKCPGSYFGNMASTTGSERWVVLFFYTHPSPGDLPLITTIWHERQLKAIWKVAVFSLVQVRDALGLLYNSMTHRGGRQQCMLWLNEALQALTGSSCFRVHTAGQGGLGSVQHASTGRLNIKGMTSTCKAI